MNVQVKRRPPTAQASGPGVKSVSPEATTTGAHPLQGQATVAHETAKGGALGTKVERKSHAGREQRPKRSEESERLVTDSGADGEARSRDEGNDANGFAQSEVKGTGESRDSRTERGGHRQDGA